MAEKKNDGGGGGSAKKPNQFFGVMEPYLLGEDFKAYMTRFSNYLELNAVTDGIFKIRLLTNLMGPTASQKLINACKPKTPKEFTFAQIEEKCEAIFCGVKYTIAEHYKFNNRHQQEGESVTDYGIELQAMAENCKFGDFLDTALRDRFVAGLCDGHMKAKILNEAKEMKFDEVMKMAVNAEMVAENVKIMAHNGDVNKIRRGRLEGRLGRRQRSSSSEDDQQQGKKQRSWRENRRCYKCRETGHYANNCPERSPSSSKSRAKYTAERSKSDKSKIRSESHQDNVNFLGDDEDNINLSNLRLSDSDSSVNGIFRAVVNEFSSSQNRSGKETVCVQVAGQPMVMEWDTGSCVTLISLDTYRKFFSRITMQKVSVPLAVITGEEIQIQGQIEVEVNFEEVTARLYLVIAETGKKFTPLLGRDWIDVFRPNWRSFFKGHSIANRWNEDFKSFQNVEKRFLFYKSDVTDSGSVGHSIVLRTNNSLTHFSGSSQGQWAGRASLTNGENLSESKLNAEIEKLL
jgi:Zinc knuckle